MATQSWVNREYTWGLCTHPCGAPVFRASEVGVLFLTFTTWGRPVRKVQYSIAQGGVEAQGPQLDDELGGYLGVECWAVVNDQHSYICIPLVQMG